MDPLITKTIQGVLENTIFNKIIALNLNIPSPILRAIVSRVAEQTAPAVVQEVTKNANFQLNTIPNNRIGSVNPVNIVTGNQGPADLTNNLTNIIQNQMSAQVTDKIVTSIQNQLRLVLPADKLNIINFNNLAATLVQSVTPTVNQTINTALGGFASAIFGRGSNPLSSLTSVNKLFGSLPAADAQIQVDKQFDGYIASKALTEAQNYDINETENKEKLEVLNKGFTDPNAKYPTKEYAGSSDTNKLAQGDSRGTIVQDKNDTRMKGAKLPGGDAWDQPESAFRGAYPYNKVTQTESGHVIEIDDTPGSERLHVYHKSGTFIEIDGNGSVIKRAVGSSYEIIDKNGKIAIAGTADISINGACNIYVGNDANIEVEGDVNLKCYNDITAQAGGTLNLSATEEVNITSGNINMQAFNSMNLISNVALNMHATVDINMLANANIFVSTVDFYQNASSIFNQAGNVYIKTNEGGDGVFIDSNSDINILAASIFNQAGNVYIKTNEGGNGVFVESEKKINFKAKEDINTQTLASINTKAATDIKQQAGGVISNKASGQFAADGSAVHLNSGNSVDAGTATASVNSTPAKASKPAALAGISNIGVLEGRKDIFNNSKDDPQALSLADNRSLLLEEETASQADVDSQKSLLISEGFATAAEIDAAPVVIEKESVASEQSTTVSPNEDLKKATKLPGNYNLSPNFTIEMLSSKAAVSRDEIVAHSNYSYGDIAFNLQAIALNVLEPVKKLYPNMLVTSAFRSPGNASNAKTSQHPLGQGVDIQFKGATKAEYYEIALKLARVLKYDQLILEYCNYAKNPWIHVSYSVKTNRSSVLTFFNHKKYGDGLTQLA
jgi:uncharacterized protein YcbK (DUF882 family)